MVKAAARGHRILHEGDIVRELCRMQPGVKDDVQAQLEAHMLDQAVLVGRNIGAEIADVVEPTDGDALGRLFRWPVLQRRSIRHPSFDTPLRSFGIT